MKVKEAEFQNEYLPDIHSMKRCVEYVHGLDNGKVETFRTSFDDKILTSKRINTSNEKAMNKFFNWEYLGNVNIYITCNGYGEDYKRDEAHILSISSFLNDYDYKDYKDIYTCDFEEEYKKWCNGEVVQNEDFERDFEELGQFYYRYPFKGRNFDNFEDLKFVHFLFDIVNASKELPVRPTYIACSGRGVHLLFALSVPMAIKNREDIKYYKEYLQIGIKGAVDEIIGLKRDRNADKSTQVTRLIGSINNKEKGRAYNTFFLEESGYKYKVDELWDAFNLSIDKIDALKEEYKKPKNNKTNVRSLVKREKTAKIPKVHEHEHIEIDRDYNGKCMKFVSASLRRTLYNRVKFLERLLELRNFKPPHREEFLFVYFNTALPVYGHKAAEKTIYLNSLLIDPYDKEDIIRKIINYVPDNSWYSFTNDEIIKRLEITEEELEELKTVRKKRSEKKAKRDKKYEDVLRLYRLGRSLGEISKITGLSKSSVAYIVKKNDTEPAIDLGLLLIQRDTDEEFFELNRKFV